MFLWLSVDDCKDVSGFVLLLGCGGVLLEILVVLSLTEIDTQSLEFMWEGKELLEVVMSYKSLEL